MYDKNILVSIIDNTFNTQENYYNTCKIIKNNKKITKKNFLNRFDFFEFTTRNNFSFIITINKNISMNNYDKNIFYIEHIDKFSTTDNIVFWLENLLKINKEIKNNRGTIVKTNKKKINIDEKINAPVLHLTLNNKDIEPEKIVKIIIENL